MEYKIITEFEMVENKDNLYLPNKLEVIKECAFHNADISYRKNRNIYHPIIYFPKSIKKIESEAFFGVGDCGVIFERGCSAELASFCFGGRLKTIYLPATITSIDSGAVLFKETIICCEKNSAALDYARKNNNPCVDYNEDYDKLWGEYSFRTRDDIEKEKKEKAEAEERCRIECERQKKQEEKEKKEKAEAKERRRKEEAEAEERRRIECERQKKIEEKKEKAVKILKCLGIIALGGFVVILLLVLLGWI